MNPFYLIDSALLTQLKWVKVEFMEPVSDSRIEGAIFDSVANTYVVKTFAWAPSNQAHTAKWVQFRRLLPTWDNQVPRFSLEDDWAGDLHRSLIDLGLYVSFKVPKPDGSIRTSVKDTTGKRGVFTFWASNSVYPLALNTQGFVLAMAAYHYFFGASQLEKIEKSIRGVVA